MFIEYQSSVLRNYQKKRADNTISPRLSNPTPAKIKEECIAVCEERYTTRDRECLRTFFGQRENCAAYIQAIRKHETDKFKPLVKYLRGNVGMTDVKNIELLAWLIDFESRPFEVGKRYDDTSVMKEGGLKVKKEEEEDEEDANEEVIPVEILTESPVPEKEMLGNDVSPDVPKSPKSNLKIQPAVIIMILIMSVSTCFYLLLSRKPRSGLTGKEGCMYWAGDHYEQVSCNQKFGSDTLVVAFDSVKLNHFKKINEPDTITGRSKGSVWYVKVNEGIEFYTSDGFHPIQIQKRLMPITDYILFKHVHSNKN